MELKEIVETLQKAETKIKVQEEAIKHYKEDVKDLEKQLAEKDKEIKRLNGCMMSEQQVRNVIENDIQTLKYKLNVLIRHQVCEEIRASIKYSAIFITDNTLTQKERQLIKDQFESDKETIYDILDQIEQGESK